MSESNVCIWTQDDEYSDSFSTSCGNAFMLNDGTPHQNGMLFCCFCGAHLHENIYTHKEP